MSPPGRLGVSTCAPEQCIVPLLDQYDGQTILLPQATADRGGHPGASERCQPDIGQLDAVEWLNGLPAESVNLVVTDPPYESLEKHRAIGTTTRLKHSKSSSNDWFSIFPNSRFPELFAAIHRVLRRNSHFY